MAKHVQEIACQWFHYGRPFNLKLMLKNIHCLLLLLVVVLVETTHP
jgi:hypothetical protein